jgi:hypothetical protein
MTIMAAVGAHQNRVEFEQAKSAILGTLVCEKTGEDSWAGSVKLSQPYGLAHGISLVQPATHAEPWEDVTVKGKYTSDGDLPPFDFEQTSNFWTRGTKCELALPRPPIKSQILTVEVSGLRGVWRENMIELAVINNLCGCERMVGHLLTVTALVAGLISVVLGLFTMRAFRSQKLPHEAQSRHA